MQKVSIFRTAKCKDNPYAMIDKSLLDSEDLSWQAKGLLAYFLSLPDNWDIRLSQVQRKATNGQKSLLSAMKELREAGFVRKKTVKDDKGRFSKYVYEVFENPQTENPYMEKPYMENRTLLNTQYSNNTLTKNTNTKNTDFDFLENSFEKFWDKYPRKQDKVKAKQVFFELNPDKGLFADMLAGLDRYCRSEHWQQCEAKFIPHAATWLSRRRWLDRIEVADDGKVCIVCGGKGVKCQQSKIYNKLIYLCQGCYTVYKSKRSNWTRVNAAQIAAAVRGG